MGGLAEEETVAATEAVDWEAVPAEKGLVGGLAEEDWAETEEEDSAEAQALLCCKRSWSFEPTLATQRLSCIWYTQQRRQWCH